VLSAVKLADSGFTLTVVTGAAVTVRAALPLLPSLVAVMFTVPALTAVTSPVSETVAAAVLSELQVIVRPVRTPPLASRSVAKACVVPTASMVVAASATLTDATGAAVTVNIALPALPSLVAVMLAVPAATAVTRPVLDTVATAVLSELHATARPLSVPPLPSSVIAVACAVSTAVMEVGVRATVTDATGTAVTVMDAFPLFPSLVAVIIAVPMDNVVTSPVLETIATTVLPDAQVISRPVSSAPAASRAIAVAWVDWPS
jgi:hypothetical protein